MDRAEYIVIELERHGEASQVVHWVASEGWTFMSASEQNDLDRIFEIRESV